MEQDSSLDFIHSAELQEDDLRACGSLSEQTITRHVGQCVEYVQADTRKSGDDLLDEGQEYVDTGFLCYCTSYFAPLQASTARRKRTRLRLLPCGDELGWHCGLRSTNRPLILSFWASCEATLKNGSGMTSTVCHGSGNRTTTSMGLSRRLKTRSVHYSPANV
jgi:hypothetical protein